MVYMYRMSARRRRCSRSVVDPRHECADDVDRVPDRKIKFATYKRHRNAAPYVIEEGFCNPFYSTMIPETSQTTMYRPIKEKEIVLLLPQPSRTILPPRSVRRIEKRYNPRRSIPPTAIVNPGSATERRIAEAEKLLAEKTLEKDLENIDFIYKRGNFLRHSLDSFRQLAVKAIKEHEDYTSAQRHSPEKRGPTDTEHCNKYYEMEDKESNLRFITHKAGEIDKELEDLGLSLEVALHKVYKPEEVQHMLGEWNLYRVWWGDIIGDKQGPSRVIMNQLPRVQHSPDGPIPTSSSYDVEEWVHDWNPIDEGNDPWMEPAPVPGKAPDPEMLKDKWAEWAAAREKKNGQKRRREPETVLVDEVDDGYSSDDE